MVGLSTWGNEPDVFRYAKAGRASWWNVPTIVIPYFVGAFLFPIMGYMIAALSNQPDFSASIKYVANFTLFGLAGLMLVVLLVNQWAVQDGNPLHLAINGAQNLLSRIPAGGGSTVIGLGWRSWPHRLLPSLTRRFASSPGSGRSRAGGQHHHGDGRVRGAAAVRAAARRCTGSPPGRLALASW
jgi:hypothetical protein